ncbi:cysteine-rich receptor-like protein kinase 10 [Nicotiana attenuata]|uniref:Cysteine-rich receptor-like protein kinase 10 n=1 Tax=Nicotiana attenuata TaxID=49451 RepID=A0A314L250_NICAT|nr:cysteine-rich receptor-like protein kinase 10 [Nicotiana attenuata]
MMGKKFATKEANFSSPEKLYTLAQCTPDLSDSSCDRCLSTAIGNLPRHGSRGGRVLLPSCNVRYELYSFYNVTAVALPPPPPVRLSPPPPSSQPGPTTSDQDENEISTAESLQYQFTTIQAATTNFSADNKIGEGGFGVVYKGILPNGQEIAVKRLSRSSGQEEKLLVYEFVPNKSLDYFLFDPEKQQLLNWSRRYKIIGGIARGLLYLHEDSRLRVIHRDLKTSNILLDADMNPKTSDFGMARIFGIDQSEEITGRIVGTYGYMSPEYAMHGQYSVKSNVFSFGVLLLEIISGKKNSSFYQSDGAEDLLSYVWKNWRDGTRLNIMDPTFGESYSRNEVIYNVYILDYYVFKKMLIKDLQWNLWCSCLIVTLLPSRRLSNLHSFFVVDQRCYQKGWNQINILQASRYHYCPRMKYPLQNCNQDRRVQCRLL